MHSPRSRTRRSFLCEEPGCGRSFLRQEHLQRHRLNHQPAKIFSCDICPKSFVRQDLHRRHKSRHEKGMFFRNTGGIVNPSQASSSTSSSSHQKRTVPQQAPAPPMHAQNDCMDVPGETLTQQRNEPLQPREDDLNSIWPGFVQLHDVQDDLNWFFEPAQGVNDLVSPPQPPFDLQLPMVWPSDNDNGESGNSLEGEKLDPLLDNDTTQDSEWVIARSNLLDALCQLDMQILESPFFNIDNLKMFYELYLKHYHPHFPIFHQPTLSVMVCEPLLLIAILDLGSTMATDETLFQLGQQVHNSLRVIIINCGMFEPPIPLWCLQALLLVQAYGKMISSRKNYEMAHIFHGAILTMMKRGSIYLVASTSRPPRPNDPPQATWHRWISEESWRRTAFFAFAMDAQHACVFGHSPVLSVSDMRMALPCQESLWECTSPESWQALNNQEKPAPLFLPTLKSLLRGNPVPMGCSEYARFVLLHGLMSLQTHLQGGSRVTLGIEAWKLHTHPNTQANEVSTQTRLNSTSTWANTIDTAITTWSTSLFSLQPSLCLEAARPLYRIAQITLHVSVLDIHTLAMNPPSERGGDPNSDILIPNTNALKARTRMQRWANTDSSREACRYALLLVQETMFSGKRYTAREDNIAPRPWCLYIAVLTLWAYGVITEAPSTLPQWQQGDTAEGAGAGAGAEEYMIRMTSAMQKGNTIGPIMGAGKTAGLIRAVRDAFTGCRWELLQEAHLVLGRLVGETVLDPGGTNKTLI